ncbi:MAG: aldehyde ferredoxin oxidoreductase family protein [Dehalococcoidia bacterium]|nr:MAG: aldehyde ferredoxin oxidoreductase family protein [Dehalococcoidia bacterium]
MSFPGYNGKILFVNLTTGVINEESLPEQVYRDYIGGVGLGVRVLYERMKPNTDPLGPDNILGFLVGILTGTGIHGARHQIVTKSPVTGGWGDANSGGSFATELKATGYDGIFFSGISPRPVYVFLKDGKVEIKDASHLWGKDTLETEDSLREELGDDRVKISCIGPAGEKQSLLACIRHEGSAAGRSGVGAVMGSKRLKAFVIKGTKKVPIADPEHFVALRKEYLKSVKETDHPWVEIWKKWGTCGIMSNSVELGDAPTKNWAIYGPETFPTYKKLDGDEVIKYVVKKHACTSCPMGCKGWVRVDNKYGGYTSSKLEYETVALLGASCLIDDIEAVGKGNDVCNRLGLDTIGAGSVVAFAMECYEQGIVTKEDTDGLDLTWGNGKAMITLIEQIGLREGFGAVLADGSARAAERIGKGAEKYAMHVGGQDMPAHDPRVSIGMGWGYVCDPTPGRHTASIAATAYYGGLDFPESNELGLPPLEDPFDLNTNVKVYATCSDIERFWWAAGLCTFAWWPENLPLVQAVKAVTGWQDFNIQEALRTGRRIQTLRQAFNIREGIKTSEWRLPKRLTEAPRQGPFAGRGIDADAMKEMGYAALGWDAKTGKPLDSTLLELGLKELVGALP